MAEKPILFSGAMVRAVINGGKTQTRRVAKQVPNYSHLKWNDGPHKGEPRNIMDWDLSTVFQADEDYFNGRYSTKKGSFYVDVQTDVDDFSRMEIFCPYGKPGDRLWVRETWIPVEFGSYEPICGEARRDACQIEYAAAAHSGYHTAWDHYAGKWRPSIFMPRWASRLTLEITQVRVERVQDISEEDAKAEGIQVLPLQSESDPSAWYQSAPGVHQERSAKASFHGLWDSINSKRGFGWEKNPWVWAISFRKVEAHAH